MTLNNRGGEKKRKKNISKNVKLHIQFIGKNGKYNFQNCIVHWNGTHTSSPVSPGAPMSPWQKKTKGDKKTRIARDMSVVYMKLIIVVDECECVHTECPLIDWCVPASRDQCS